jgi:hypothetical protein
MPRGSRYPVIVQREIEPAHRALRKLRATSCVMAPIGFCMSRCLRCWIWRKRHPAPHCTPFSRVAYPPQCVRFADRQRKRGSHAVATTDGNATPRSRWLSSVAWPTLHLCSPIHNAPSFPERAESQSRTTRPASPSSSRQAAITSSARMPAPPSRRACLQSSSRMSARS